MFLVVSLEYVYGVIVLQEIELVVSYRICLCINEGFRLMVSITKIVPKLVDIV